MKLIILLAICVISTFAFDLELLSREQFSEQQDPTCRDVKYGGDGEKCVVGQNSKQQCKQFLACVGGTCKPGHIGAYCTQHSDCFLSSPWEEGIKCINSKCTKKRYNGSPCSMNDDCYSSMCREGKCAGYKIGENCRPEQPVQCEKGLYCSWNGALCVNQKKTNERCDDYEPKEVQDIPEGSNYMVICEGGTQCIRKGNATRGSCEPVYFAKEGESCMQTSNCYPGLACRQGKCIVRMFGPGDTPCAGEGRNCTAAQNERCVCIDGQKGSCKRTANANCGFQQASRDWADCWKKFGCHWERNIFTAMLTEMFQRETCMGSNCGHIPRAALCCRNAGFDGIAYSTASLGPLPCASNSALIAILVLLALVVVASVAVSGIILGVWLYQRRRNESFERLPD